MIAGWRPALRPYVYQEFPKWIDGPGGPVVVRNAAEERQACWELARNVGRRRANEAQRSRADALAAELGPEVMRLRTRGRSFRNIADILNRRGIQSARRCEWGPGQIWRLIKRARSASLGRAQ